MKLGRYLSGLTKPELDELREQMNLSDEDLVIFNHLSKGKSNILVAEVCMVSSSTLDNRIKIIKSKIERLKGLNL